MGKPAAAGVSFENRMLERYGCGTVRPVAGARHASSLRGFILSWGFYVSPKFFADMLCDWFGGFPAGFRVRALSVGSFEFEVAHAGVAWEIVRKGRWKSGIIKVSFSMHNGQVQPSHGARPRSCTYVRHPMPVPCLHLHAINPWPSSVIVAASTLPLISRS